MVKAAKVFKKGEKKPCKLKSSPSNSPSPKSSASSSPSPPRSSFVGYARYCITQRQAVLFRVLVPSAPYFTLRDIHINNKNHHDNKNLAACTTRAQGQLARAHGPMARADQDRGQELAPRLLFGRGGGRAHLRRASRPPGQAGEFPPEREPGEGGERVREEARKSLHFTSQVPSR